MMEPVVAIYGATGRTGRRVAAECLHRGLDVVLAGRNAAALDELAAELDSPARVRTQVAAVHDRGSLRTLAESADALIHCSGPYEVTGMPVATATAEAGCHYLDQAVEPHHVLRMFEELDGPARRAGIVMIPQMGLYGGLADLLAAAVTEGMTDVDRVTAGYWVTGQRTRIESMLGDLGQVTFTDGSLHIGPVEIRDAVYPFPTPVGPRPVIAPFPSGEVVTIPRHVPARTVEVQLAAESLVGAAGPGDFLVAVRANSRVGGGANGHVRGRDVARASALASVEAAVRLIRGEGPDRAGVFSAAEAFPAVPFLLVLEDLGAFTFALRL